MSSSRESAEGAVFIGTGYADGEALNCGPQRLDLRWCRNDEIPTNET